MFDMKKLMKPALAAAIALALPASASALTVVFDDLNTVGLDGTFTDNAGVDKVGLTGSIGTFSFTAFAADAFDTPGNSELSSVALSVTGGGGADLMIYVSQAGYGGAAAAPALSNITYDLNGTKLGSTASGSAYYDLTNALGIPAFPASAVQVGSTISASNPGGLTPYIWGGSEAASVALTSPFSMTQVYSIGSSSGTTSFDAVMIAAIPVPAAGFLLLTALGGLGLARRRKKSA